METVYIKFGTKTAKFSCLLSLQILNMDLQIKGQDYSPKISGQNILTYVGLTPFYPFYFLFVFTPFYS